MEIIQRVNSANPDTVSWSLDLSGAIQRVGDRARLFALMERQGAHGRLESSDRSPSIANDLYAGPDLVADYPTSRTPSSSVSRTSLFRAKGGVDGISKQFR